MKLLAMMWGAKKEKNKAARIFLSLALFLVFLFTSNTPFAYANVLGNGDFSQSIGNGTAANWDNTNGATRITTAPNPPGTFSTLPNGSALQLPDAAAGTDRFTFQTYDNVKPGDYVTFTVYAETNIQGSGRGDIAIEFKHKNEDGTDQLIGSPINLSDNGFSIRSAQAPPGGGYQAFSIAGTAPEETNRVVFTIKTRKSAGAAVANRYLIVTQAIGGINPVGLSVSASKKNVAPGDAVGINARFKNASGNTYQNTQMKFKIPQGFDYADQSVRVNGLPAGYRDGFLVVDVGNMVPNQEIHVSFVMLVSSGVQLGRTYALESSVDGVSVQADYAGTIDNVLTPGKLSQKVTTQFSVEGDPVFEQGTVIGKVFNDLNQNSVQDCGEDGVPWVRLYTEEGIGIVTDEHGRYHIPGVTPGRHVIKIDGHSLPEGTKFVTEEAYLVKTTPGIMNKANFAVLLPPSGIPENFKKDLMVMVTQGVDVSRPTLDVQMEPSVVKLGIGVLEKDPVFTFNNNYGRFIKKWALEIRDEFGKPMWIGYGVGQPPSEVVWSGMTEAGLLIPPGIYSYQLKVRDSKNREDWTPLKFFEVYSKLDARAEKNYHPEIPPVGDFNIFKDGKQSIPLVAKPVVRVQGKTQPNNVIKINDTPVTVDPENGMFQKEFFVEPGEYEAKITAITPSGETTSFHKKIKVKDSTFFMVALGEQQFGENFAKGAMETADSDVYRNGFRQDGRMAFFLKGKLKGKFLVKAHYDTADNRSNFFTSLDPNKYYPIYGDGSTRDYEARDTAQRLFLLVEMDRSYAQWGSYKTEFNDTELTTYSRTLSGLKVNYETVGTNIYGDPKRGFKVFSAKSDRQADHNELYATGGTLFYTRNRNMIEGSEKVRVEIRDKIQNMAISSYDLQPGADYEINYEEGRILLTRPLSSVSATDTMTTADMLNGNPVYLIVDYEYDPGPSLDSSTNQGIRGYTDMGDHIKIGATAVNESRPGNDDYNLRGVDATLKFGRNTKITAEYAQSINQQLSNSVSYDGGISYANLSPLHGRHTKDLSEAYLIKAQSKPVKNLEMTGYVQELDPGFSNNNMRSQEGLKKYGLASKYKFTDSLAIRYRFDDGGVVSQLEPLNVTNNSAPYQNMRTHTAQIVYDDGKYLGEIEYQRRNLDPVTSISNITPTMDNQLPFKNGVTGKVGYHINDRLLPYVKVQTVLDGKADQQFGGGVRYEIINNLFAYLEQMFGPLGDSTNFGFERQHGNGVRSYANIRSFDRGIGDKTLSTAIGNSFSLSEHSRFYSERQYSSYQNQDGFSDILGYEGKAGDHWDYGGKFERRHLNNANMQLINDAAQNALARANTFNTVGGNVAYALGKKFRARSYVEIRADQTLPKMSQLVTQNSLQYQINEDVAFLTRFNLGDTMQYNPDNSPATFVELTSGFAIRPVKLDKLNMLARYTYLQDLGSDAQYDNSYYDGFQFDQAAHIFAMDVAYDLNRYFGLVEKLAFKRSSVSTSVGDMLGVNTFLSANRINFHVTRKWDLAIEYRILFQTSSADNLKHGALVEIDREFYEYVRLGLGYNFTDFNDDLRNANNSQSHGPFIRMTGKF